MKKKIIPDDKYWTCQDCGKQIECGLMNWVQHNKNDCTEERQRAFANTHNNLMKYREYLKKDPDPIKLSDTLN